jgi:pimeloyl-ACP methyl ester carboxylesterase
MRPTVLPSGRGWVNIRRVVPDIRYVRRDGVSVAYEVFGEGPDLLFIPGFVSNLEYQWHFELTARFFDRLSSFSRVIEVDRRGTGLSDRLSPEHLPPLEVLVEDLLAVMDAAGSERAAVAGWLDGCFQATLFAATYPERTSALVLYGASACGTCAADYPWAWTSERWEAFLDEMANGWGTTEYMTDLIRWAAPSIAESDELTRQTIAYWRLASDTRAAVTLERLYSQTDVRQILPAIHVPTLVLHRVDDPTEPVEGARYIADRIPGAKLVELPGADYAPWAGDQDQILDEIEELLTGTRRGSDPDRVLSTVLFTDIVGSTEKAAEVGDRRWRELLARHHERVRAQLPRFRGTEIDTAGDGLLATFDGPARAVRCAGAIVAAVAPLGLQIRAGLHTGEVELMEHGIGGIGVHIGARVAALAGPSEVLVSSTVKDLVAGSGLVFEDRGTHELKGVPGDWRIYAVAQEENRR